MPASALKYLSRWTPARENRDGGVQAGFNEPQNIFNSSDSVVVKGWARLRIHLTHLMSISRHSYHVGRLTQLLIEPAAMPEEPLPLSIRDRFAFCLNLPPWPLALTVAERCR